MYQALYRKYRPKNFDDVVGQDVIIKTLKNSIVQNKISHAYLFAGPRGSGKTTIAKILAKTVNCQHLNGAEMCNECVCCTQNSAQNMDIIEIDAASNNGVDEIREINNKVNLVPSLGKYKIYIIDEVHMLTIGAFNALLKTLEEPPSHVIFILATTDPQKVPITILSRCQRFDFKKISESKITERLTYIINQEKIKIDSEALQEIARLGDGSLRDAIGILDQVISYSSDKVTLQDIHDVNGTISQDNLKQLITNLFTNNLLDVMNAIDSYSDSGKSIVKITEEIILFFKNLILAKVSEQYQNNLYLELTKDISTEKLLNNIQIMNEALLDMKRFSNPKMLLELALIKIMTVSSEIQNKQVEVFNSSTKQNNQGFDNSMPNKEQLKEKKTTDSNSSKCQTYISREMEIKTNIAPEMQKWVQIRIQNTLAEFSKKSLVELKNKIICDEYLLDEKYNQYASIVMDGVLKAASDKYLIFVYKTDHLALKFNENILAIEKFLNMLLDKNYKAVAVCEEDWNTIKEEFNNKTKKFNYTEETINIEDIINKKKNAKEDDIKDLFGDLVEYN